MGLPLIDPSLSLNAAVLQPVPPWSLPHFRSIGGKYAGLALMNFALSMEFSGLVPKLVNSRYEIAPDLRVALSS